MYRLLKQGEIIRFGDETDISTGWNDEPNWVPAICIGEPAPDLQYIAHRLYRRPTYVMIKLQTAVIILIILAAVLAVSLAALGWLIWTYSWPVIIPEGLRDCLEWSSHHMRETGLGGFMRCLP